MLPDLWSHWPWNVFRFFCIMKTEHQRACIVCYGRLLRAGLLVITECHQQVSNVIGDVFPGHPVAASKSRKRGKSKQTYAEELSSHPEKFAELSFSWLFAGKKAHVAKEPTLERVQTCQQLFHGNLSVLKQEPDLLYYLTKGDETLVCRHKIQKIY